MRFKRIFFLYSDKSKRWSANLIARAYADVFGDLGFKAFSVKEGSNIENPAKSDLVFAVGVDSLFAVSGHPWSEMTCGLLNFNYVGLSNRSKRFWERAVAKNAARCFWYMPKYVLNYSPLDIDALKDVGCGNAAFCPLGYHPSFESKEKPPEENFDIGFMGYNMRDSLRPEKLKRIDEKYNLLVVRGQKGRHVVTKNVERGAQNIFKAKLFLNLEKGELNHWWPKPTDGFRDIATIIYGLSNKRCVLNEGPNIWIPPFVNNDHWVSGPFETLLEEIPKLIEDEERRKAIGISGYEFIKTYWRLDVHVLRAVKELNLEV